MPLKGKSNNPAGRPKGIVNARVQQWNELSDSITSVHTERFNQYMNSLWNSENPNDQYKAAQLFISVLEYFKPKQARISHSGDADAPVIIHIPSNL